MSQQEKVKYFDRVKSVRKALGLTQEELGAKLGVSGNLIYKIEADTKPLVGRTLRDFLEIESQLGLGQIDKDSVKPGLVAREESPEYKGANEWKAEALNLRNEVARLKVVIQLLASTTRPVSSTEAVDAEEFVTDIVNRIAAQAAAKAPSGPKPKS